MEFRRFSPNHLHVALVPLLLRVPGHGLLQQLSGLTTTNKLCLVVGAPGWSSGLRRESALDQRERMRPWVRIYVSSTFIWMESPRLRDKFVGTNIESTDYCHVRRR